MNTFYANKYPISGCTQIDSEGKHTTLANDVPVGTVFMIDSICGNMLNLKTPEKKPILVYVDAAMLQFGFTESESIS